MLRMYREYYVDHYRFREHLRVAMVMAMVAPLCALLFYFLIDWWNPWLWGSCGVGLSLALALYSAVILHERPANMTALGRQLVVTSHSWFPFFFIIIQSLIAMLIVLFIWFSITSLAMDVSSTLHAVVIALCGLIPVRRYIWARLEKKVYNTAYILNEIIRTLWHTLFTLFLALIIISGTIENPGNLSQENLIWQTMVWVPALLYITFTITVTCDHLLRHRKPQDTTAHIAPPPKEEPFDRF